MLKCAVSEPLVQFLAIGAGLFAGYALIHGPQQRATDPTITISEGRVNQLIESYLLLAGRVPSKAELDNLVDDYVTEEIDYREAVAMGLDADDTIVRRPCARSWNSWWRMRIRARSRARRSSKSG